LQVGQGKAGNGLVAELKKVGSGPALVAGDLDRLADGFETGETLPWPSAPSAGLHAG
jgi:hypothetical protein